MIIYCIWCTQFTIELPYVAFNAIIFSTISYSMIQFEWQAAKFFWLVFFVFTTTLFFCYWGMIAVAATPNPQAAAILATFPFALFSLFSGLPITRKVSSRALLLSNIVPAWLSHLII
jgi:hypothetical protein